MDLKKLHDEYGQSIWLDDIRRHLLESGEFARLVKEDGVRGVTSNPSIFEHAIAGSSDYSSAIERYEGKKDEAASVLYERLAIADLQQAADLLRPVYDAADRADGFVSLEVSPYLAHDTQATVAEARRLWRTVERENLMIKVPATAAGMPAIRQLIGEGINVNVTLLFSRAAAFRAAEAYMLGLEERLSRGGDLTRVASVASVFVSRLDVLVNPILEARARAAPAAKQAALRALIGKVALANAKLAYQDRKLLCATSRWKALLEKGARVQRLLWASTSSKDPRFSDVQYVEALIGPETVDTLPPATLAAFLDHGTAADRLGEDLDEAGETLVELAEAGVSLDELTARLLEEGVKEFSSAFDKLLGSIERKRAGILKSALDRMSSRLPAPLDAAVKAALEDWRTGGKVRRLWARDASLWTGHDEGRWLDWLAVADQEQGVAPALMSFAKDAQRDFTHAVVLGMGGSSLCPDVLARTFGRVEGFPELHVLDSTDPAQIRAMEARVDLARTLFIVSSKSGTTLEPNILMAYFFDRVRAAVGEAKAGQHFVVVTDPGSAMQKSAEAQRVARLFFGLPGIGGRYSALSSFGMVPAAVMGLDVPDFLDRTARMVNACAACVPPEQNPGVLLGVILGSAARMGRDKVTLIASPGVEALGAWLEQLLAESTGKEGKGIVPIDGEPLGAPGVYGADRLFAYLRLDGAADPAQDAAVEALERAGQPVVRLAIEDPRDLGQEFFRWEIATAVAGAILGIDAFNQPDVEASKVAARELTDAYEKSGALPQESPFHEEGGFKLFADGKNQAALEKAAGSDRTLVGYLRAHLGRLQPGDYCALLGYLERNDADQRVLQAIRGSIRDSKRVATCLGFGPRFLHSTGQAYKGGPNSGVFLQLTCDDAADLPVPGHRFTFGVVKAAQARGDLRVLSERDRRALRLHLGSDVRAGIAALQKAIEWALA